MAERPNSKRGGDKERHDGMTKYVPASAAAELSAALFALSRPPAIRAQGEVTNSMCSWFYDTQGDRWILIDDQREVRVHELAELNGIADILAPFIGYGLVQADIDGLESLVAQSRGQRLVVYEAFPKLFQLKSMENPTGLGRTREQMLQENRLANPTFP